MRYLTADEVVWLHDLEDEAPLRSRHLLESAVGAPQQTFGGMDLFPTIHLKAAALMRSVSQNQPFIDGNKRAALMAAHAFYGFNGYLFVPPSDTEVIHLLVDLAVGETEAGRATGVLGARNTRPRRRLATVRSWSVT